VSVKTVSQGIKPTNFLIDRFLPVLLWVVAGALFAGMVFMVFNRDQIALQTSAQVEMPTLAAPVESLAEPVSMPGIEAPNKPSIYRQANLRTIIPTRSRTDAVTYVVDKGDSVFSISRQYDLEPETVLWANYDLLDDNPNMLSIGQQLVIPPTDGVYYVWQAGDTLEKVAERFLVDKVKILAWPGNRLDMTNPVIEPDTKIMIPDGWRENRQWLVPTVWRANSGASRVINGPGACDLPEGGAYGTGGFIWPTGNHNLSGNDYWSGHLGIDIAAADGAPVVAADSGMVVYAGSIGGGYGNMVMIDHGNGYHTLYAHLSSVLVSCGQSVYQGSLIALSGSTGNSTGPHLHFEVRYQGSFINPWYVLP
jgi:murein DD-endopeptidase MepM/ murein hydrolase activator NlpD